MARFLLVKYYEGNGSISKTSLYFKTTRNTVRKAIKRYKEGGEENLFDRTRRPKHFYRKTKYEIEKKVIRLRKETNYCKVRLSGRLRDIIYFQTDWGEGFDGMSIKKLNKIQKRILEPLGVRLVRLPKGKKEYNG